MTSEQFVILAALMCVAVAFGWFLAETLDAVVEEFMGRSSK